MFEFVWEDINKIMETINKARDPKNREWKWVQNSRWEWTPEGWRQGKYIDIRVDMRDGHCLLRDRHGKNIHLKDLEFQHKTDD